MATQIHEQSFTIDTKGETTGEEFKGVFRVRTRLSHRDRLLIDQIRRQLLGPQPVGTIPGDQANSIADVFSNLQVRIVDAPSWFKNSQGGLDLADDNVCAEIFTQVMKAERDAINAITDAAKKAKEELSKEVASE